MTEVSPGKRIVLQRNADYFGGAKGQPHIGTIVYRPIAERNTQIAEFMTGSIDWLWQIPPDQSERLKARKGTKVIGGETMRVAYLAFDSAGRVGEHPMTDRTVRQAIAHAVDREAIVKQLKPPGARVVDLACYPGQFGCASPGAPSYEFNPEKAKKLLADAGHPNGLTIDIYGYRDRPVVEAIIGYLKNVGVTARLQWLQAAALRDKTRAGQVPFSMNTWGSTSIPDVTAILGVFFNGSSDDRARDPKVIELVKRGDTSIDPEERKRAYAEALRIIAEQVYWVPLYADSHYYVFVDQLDFTPSPDELPRFFNARWR